MKRTGPTPIDPKERFERLFYVTPGCWPWKKVTKQGNYPNFKFQGVHVRASQFSYRLYNGPILPGKVVRHTCDNTLCVNPDHLVLGTVADNCRDRAIRGRTSNQYIAAWHVEP